MERGGRRGAIGLVVGALALGLLIAPATTAVQAAEPATPDAGTNDQIIVTTTSASVPEQALEASTESAAAETGNDLDAQASSRITRTMRVVRLSEELPVAEVEAIAAELADSPDVVSARPDVRVQIAAERIAPASVTLPNDTYIADLWGLWDSSRSGGGFGTRAAAAWPTTRGAGAVVAVLDTGIQAHPDLNANLVSGYDFVDDWWAGYAAANALLGLGPTE